MRGLRGAAARGGYPTSTRAPTCSRSAHSESVSAGAKLPARQQRRSRPRPSRRLGMTGRRLKQLRRGRDRSAPTPAGQEENYPCSAALRSCSSRVTSLSRSATADASVSGATVVGVVGILNEPTTLPLLWRIVQVSFRAPPLSRRSGRTVPQKRPAGRGLGTPAGARRAMSPSRAPRRSRSPRLVGRLRRSSRGAGAAGDPAQDIGGGDQQRRGLGSEDASTETRGDAALG